MQETPGNTHRGGGGSDDGTKATGYRKPGQGKPATETTDGPPSQGGGS